MDLLQQVVHKSRYAKWLPEKKRREHWPETVERYIQNVVVAVCNKQGYAITEQEVSELRNGILNFEALPSMRAMMTAGPALDREQIAGYNCAYLAIKSKRDFAEALYILMCGTGVGFSCERQYISQLPVVPAKLEQSDDVITVADSKMGWAKAFNKLVNSLYEGDIPRIDYSKVRPAGSRLKTFGGRASGPEPLRRLFDFTINTFRMAVGRRLSSIEVHDILCTTGEVVVVGGVRRAALISLSNLTDRRMREAKTGAWWEDHRHRALANNSVAYTEKPDAEAFIEEWLSLVKSKSGERGIFNRVAAGRQAARHGRRPQELEYGCNPCSEIILRDKQFCNLSEVVARRSDDADSLRRKVRLASILGTIQSTLTDFGFVSDDWRRNCEEERLLGVSLTGIFDCPLLRGTSTLKTSALLEDLRRYACDTNKEWAEKLGIAPSAAITCVKPSGTVSQLVNASSGIHPRHSKYYIRNVRMDNKDPICEFLRTSGVPSAPDSTFPDSQVVFSFPVAAPEGATLRSELTALQHLEIWKLFNEKYTDHKPSITVSVRESEWPSVGGWVYDNFDSISGIAFLPYSDHVYKQAPYEECDEATYLALAAKMPVNLNWEMLSEDHDDTVASQELACSGDKCEII